MIRVEPHEIGYQVDADDLSSADRYELDSRAVRQAIDRYLDHRERLYDNPTPALEDTTLWLVYALGRSTRTWPEFHVYFVLARLRILLSREPRPVEGIGPIDGTVERAITDLCEEYDVEYQSGSRVEDQSGSRVEDQSGSRTGPAVDSHDWIRSLFVRLRLWCILVLFTLVRPVVLTLYGAARRSVDVRFWLHPVEPHRDRFFGAPDDLAARGRRVGYALYDVVAVAGVLSFVSRCFRTVRTAPDRETPVHVEWFADPTDLRAALAAAPRRREQIRHVAAATREPTDSPEFAYLARQVETTSTELVFHLLFIERAIAGFAETVDDDTWTHPRSPTKLTSRLLSMVGEDHDVSTVAIAPHYFAGTRINTRFTDTEIEGPASSTLPDLYAVFEPRSATTLRNQHVPGEVVVARDKVQTEAGRLGSDRTDRTDEPDPSSPSAAPSSSPSAAPVPRVERDRTELLVILDLPRENAELVGALASAVPDIPDAEIVIKPHPFYPPDDALTEDLPAEAVTVTAPDAPLEDLARSCDVCVAIYSTAAFPALVWTRPVVWVPFASPGHVRMDLIDEVGLRADDREEFGTLLERLVHDDSFYAETARSCERFAARELVPDDTAPSIAELLEDA